MAKNQATLTGINRTFEVNERARPFTLRDNGFKETRRGNFELTRTFPTSHPQGLVLKILIDEKLEKLRISTVSSNGLKTIDVTKLNHNEELLEELNFFLHGLVDSRVLSEV